MTTKQNFVRGFGVTIFLTPHFIGFFLLNTVWEQIGLALSHYWANMGCEVPEIKMRLFHQES